MLIKRLQPFSFLSLCRPAYRHPLVIVLVGCALVTYSRSRAAEPETKVDFTNEIKPIFAQNCYKCHGQDKQEASLRLDDRAIALSAGDAKGKVIAPGKSDASVLFRRISSSDPDEVMPPEGDHLKQDQIALIKKWIDGGANWDEVAAPATAPVGPPARVITAEQRAYWAFQPVKKPELPKVNNTAWVKTPVDAFILARLERESIQPAPEASKLELIRRVAFDLTGLPPTMSETEAYLADQSAQAYEAMVDRYLASERYGEQWGQHWLDVVRFGESEGFEYDTPVNGLWRFRDYVIKSFNEDKPYNQFITEQLAGDEIDAKNQEMQVAAGFHRLGPVRKNKGNQDVASSRNEVLTDRTDVVSAAFLGMTMGCARCHDHKFDPILQKDYYRLQAYMASTEAEDISLASPEEQQAWRQKTSAMTRQSAQLKRQLASAKDEDKAGIQTQIDKIEDDMPLPLQGINTIKDIAEPTPIHVLRRGDWDKKGDAVGMRPPSVLVSESMEEAPITAPKPRLALAGWLTDPQHPLVPRVMVNRLWNYHFGKGIVKTANDFGINGDKPSNQPLLDYLAASFVENGWRVKPIHRMILLSSTYRQAYETPQSKLAMAKDPDNRWVWHYERRRLAAEEIRDAMLSVSGKLNLKMGGESVFIPVDPELVNALYKPTQWAVTKDTNEHYRRSIYLVAKRNLRLPSLEVFDAPTLGASCPRRETSTHAPQALELMNGTMSNQLAKEFSDRLLREAGNDPAAQVDLAFRLAAGRPPSEQEKKVAVGFLKDQSLKEFSLAMFNLNAFLYAN